MEKSGVSSRQIRIYGAILLFLGLFLIGSSLVLTAWLAPYLLNPGESLGGTRFTGTPGQAKIIFGIFAVIAGLGVGAGFGGVWQIVTGRRNKVVAFGAVVLAILFVGVGIAIDIYEVFF